MNRFQQYLPVLLSPLLLIGSGKICAAPGDELFSDDFEGALGDNWTISDGNLAGINAYLVSAGDSGFTRGGAVTVTTTVPINLLGIGGADFSIEIGKGTDGVGTLSEDPDTADESFAVEYLEDDDLTWTQLTISVPADLADGATTSFSTSLPTNALHDGFQLRLVQGGGSGGPPANGGAGWDFWHFDDVSIVETSFTLPAPPLSASSCEEFEYDLGNWTQSDTSRSGISSVTSNSPNNSLFLNDSANTVTSDAFDGTNLSSIEVWVRKGDDSFSEDPDNGENLVLEYFDGASWVIINTFSANAIGDGVVQTPTYTVGADFVADPAFQIRFRLTGGSGANFDYWHIDDVCFSGGTPMPSLAKTVETVSAGVVLAPLAKAIPEAIVEYTITAMNLGDGAATDGSIVISDVLDDNLTLFVGDLDGNGSPFIFTNGTGSNISGLAYDWILISSTADSPVFRNSSDVSITPTPDYDASVRSFEINLRGSFFPAGAGTPQFTITYRARIE